jgi:hypothetical protein
VRGGAGRVRGRVVGAALATLQRSLDYGSFKQHCEPGHG